MPPDRERIAHANAELLLGPMYSASIGAEELT